MHLFYFPFYSLIGILVLTRGVTTIYSHSQLTNISLTQFAFTNSRLTFRVKYLSSVCNAFKVALYPDLANSLTSY